MRNWLLTPNFPFGRYYHLLCQLGFALGHPSWFSSIGFWLQLKAPCQIGEGLMDRTGPVSLQFSPSESQNLDCNFLVHHMNWGILKGTVSFVFLIPCTDVRINHLNCNRLDPSSRFWTFSTSCELLLKLMMILE